VRSQSYGTLIAVLDPDFTNFLSKTIGISFSPSFGLGN
jgi:hypothetical protein